MEGAGQNMDIEVNPFERWDDDNKATNSLIQSMEFDDNEFMGVVLSKSMELMKFDGTAPWEKLSKPEATNPTVNPDPFGSSYFGNFSSAFSFLPSPRGPPYALEPVQPAVSNLLVPHESVFPNPFSPAESQYSGGCATGAQNNQLVQQLAAPATSADGSIGSPLQFSAGGPVDFRSSLVETLARLAAAKEEAGKVLERNAVLPKTGPMSTLLTEENVWEQEASEEPPRKLTPQRGRPGERSRSPPPMRHWVKNEEVDLAADTAKHSGAKRSSNGAEKVESERKVEPGKEEKAKPRTQVRQRQRDESNLDPKEIERLEKSRLKAQRHREKVRQWKEEVSERVDILEQQNAQLVAEKEQLLAEKEEWQAKQMQWEAEKLKLQAEKAQAEADSGRLWGENHALQQIMGGAPLPVPGRVLEDSENQVLPEMTGDVNKMQEELVRLRQENRTLQSELELVRGALIAQSRTMSDLMALRQVVGVRNEEA